MSAAGDENPLLVFGYAARVFRDDERARDLESGGHLIPWMGDPVRKTKRKKYLNFIGKLEFVNKTIIRA